MCRQSRSGYWAAAALTALLCLPLAAQTAQPRSTGQPIAAPSATAPASQAPASQAPAPAADQPTAEAQPNQPLQAPVKQGFWGRLNPFARKSYVQGQLNPIRDRVNELNGLSANNANSINELDRRAKAGIAEAGNRADQANSTADAAQQQVQQTSERAGQLNQRVDSANRTLQSSDQYQVTQTAELHFKPGPAKLNSGAEQQLSSFLQGLSEQKGYVVEITAYSQHRGLAGISASQDLANAVVRYMVLSQNIPLYRIFTSGMGNASPQAVNGSPMSVPTTRRTNGGTVQIRILKSSLADSNS